MGIGFVRPHTPLHAPDKYFDLFPIEELKLSDWIPDDKKDTFWDENFKQTKNLLSLWDNFTFFKVFSIIFRVYNI